MDAVQTRRLLDLRLSGMKGGDIARELGCSAGAVYATLRDPRVRRELDWLREDLRDAVRTTAEDAATEAIDALRDLMKTGTPAIRLKAATELLDRVGMSKEATVNVRHTGTVGHAHAHAVLTPEQVMGLTEEQLDRALMQLRDPEAAAFPLQGDQTIDDFGEIVEPPPPPKVGGDDDAWR